MIISWSSKTFIQDSCNDHFLGFGLSNDLTWEQLPNTSVGNRRILLKISENLTKI